MPSHTPSIILLSICLPVYLPTTDNYAMNGIVSFEETSSTEILKAEHSERDRLSLFEYFPFSCISWLNARPGGLIAMQELLQGDGKLSLAFLSTSQSRKSSFATLHVQLVESGLSISTASLMGLLCLFSIIELHICYVLGEEDILLFRQATLISEITTGSQKLASKPTTFYPSCLILKLERKDPKFGNSTDLEDSLSCRMTDLAREASEHSIFTPDNPISVSYSMLKIPTMALTQWPTGHVSAGFQCLDLFDLVSSTWCSWSHQLVQLQKTALIPLVMVVKELRQLLHLV